MIEVLKNKFFIGQTVFASAENDFTRIITGQITEIELVEGHLSYQVRDDYCYRQYNEDSIFTDIEDLEEAIIRKLQDEIEEAYDRLKEFRAKVKND